MTLSLSGFLATPRPQHNGLACNTRPYTITNIVCDHVECGVSIVMSSIAMRCNESTNPFVQQVTTFSRLLTEAGKRNFYKRLNKAVEDVHVLNLQQITSEEQGRPVSLNFSPSCNQRSDIIS
jgi:hypothetical protein